VKIHRLIVIAGLLAALTALAGTAEAARVDRRQARQHARIVQGVRSGELTRGEVARLRAGQRHVRRAEFRAERDGVLTPRERARLEWQQDRQSRAIHRLKHNARSL
jgi:hypothetical protein